METEDHKSLRVQKIVLQRFESLERAGVRQIRKTVARASSSPAADVPESQSPRRSPERAPMPEAPTGKRGSHGESLSVIQTEVAACTRCPELASTRKQTVFGVGNPKARLCFFGEAPGADEDRLGEPFVGRAGKMLTDIIVKGMGIRREDVYILNVLKCRPPGNRNPNPDEVANCRNYFERQIEAIQPEFICCLGGVAAQSLLETNETVGRMRGRFFDYQGARVIVTYHPSYLLRTPSAKAKTWEDIQMLMREMGLPIPKRKKQQSS